MKVRRSHVILACIVTFASAGGFVAGSWWSSRPSLLTIEEARIVGNWNHYLPDESKQLDDITFYPNRILQVGNDGIFGAWSLQNGKLCVDSLHYEGESWTESERFSEPSVVYDILSFDTSDRLEIKASKQAHAILVRDI